MKMTLELNTANVQDVMDVINSLKRLIPMDSINTEEVEINQKNEVIAEMQENIDFDLLNEEISIETENEHALLKSEIEDLKRTIESLKSDKQVLIKSKQDLQNKIESLENEINSSVSTSGLENMIEGMDVNVEVGGDVVALTSEKIEEYEKQIKSLKKDVAYHEGRSNKNFEEVKRLRALIDTMSNEKRQLEKELSKAQKDFAKFEESGDTTAGDVAAIKSENESLKEKVESFEQIKEKLNKEIEFHKNRSKSNWEELKSLKNTYSELEKEKGSLEEKIKEFSLNSENLNNKEDVNKLKTELIQVKSDYESTISELRLVNDKLENEINLCKTNFSEESVAELAHLNRIKNIICANEKGAAFWNNVENSIKKS